MVVIAVDADATAEVEGARLTTHIGPALEHLDVVPTPTEELAGRDESGDPRADDRDARAHARLRLRGAICWCHLEQGAAPIAATGRVEHQEIALVPAADRAKRGRRIQRGRAAPVADPAIRAERRSPWHPPAAVIRLPEPPDHLAAGVPESLGVVVVEDRSGDARGARIG